DQQRRRGEVAVPDIVADSLEVPDTLAGIGMERQQGIGEEVVARAVGAVEIAGGGSGGDVEDSALRVDRHAGPVVGGAGVGPGILGPGVVAVLAGMRNGVETPAQLAGANIEGANVASGGGERLGSAATDNQQILINDARAGEDD